MWQILINGPGYFDTPYNLPDGDTHLGRADENDVVLTGDKVSRRHARIHVDGDQITVEDLGSRNGTQLGDQLVGAATPLKEGDVISVGENALTLRRAGEAEESRTEMVSVGADGQPAPLSPRAAELAGQVLFTRDLRENSFIASFEQARAMSVAELQQASSAEGSDHALQSLALLYKLVEALGSASSLDAFLQQMLDLVMQLAQATTGVVLIKNLKNTFTPVVVRHAGTLAQGEVPVSDAIVAEVVKKKVALCVADAQGDARFKSRESVILYGMNQVLCAPMLEGGAVLGLIYLNRHADEPGPSLEALMDLLSAIAQLAASGAQQARLKARGQGEERARRTLERFHAPDVVDRLAKESARAGAPAPRLEERRATVLAAELTGLGELMQRVPPARLAELLTEVHKRVARIVFSFGGTLDRLAGESVTALFGGAQAKPDDAARAVRAALALRREVVELMASRPAKERCGIRLALSTGKVLAGLVGAENRLEHAALGEPVTTVARLLETALPGQLLITDAALREVGQRFRASALGERSLRGRKDKLGVSELLDEDLEWKTSPGL